MKTEHNHRLIDAVEAILRKLRRPATARDIINYANDFGRPDVFFKGKTPHKTVNARIAVDILTHGDRSRFYRFGPATYGLRDLLDDTKYDHNYKRVYIGSSRRKVVSNEPVATVNADSIKFFSSDGLYTSDHYPLKILDLLDIRYVDRKAAEQRFDIKQFVSYACIMHEDKLLTFERGKYTSDDGEFAGKQSIGFGGHLSYFDLSLFDETPLGLHSNIVRELFEELYVFRKHIRRIIDRVIFVGYLMDRSTGNGRKHIGLAAIIKLKYDIELEMAALGFRNLRWISRTKTPNSFDKFEIWSQYLFRHIQHTTDWED